MRHGLSSGKFGRWRQRLWRVFLVTVLTLILTTANVPPEKEIDFILSALITGRRFDWVGWETSALLEEADWWWRGRTVSGDQGTQKTGVLAFLDQQRRIAELEERIRGEVAQLPPLDRSHISPPTVTALQGELNELHRQQQAAVPWIERILAAQVSQVLANEGLSRDGQVWPPVTFRFTTPPTWLVISPRDEIRTYRGAFLVPDIPELERTSLEIAIEKRLDVSALIVNVGGIGIWPAMIIYTASLRALLDTIAHEWTHTYLFFFRPLGLYYKDSRDLMTMNETVASIVGSEIADLTMARYYPEGAPPPAPTKSLPRASSSSQEDFNQAMRRIRLHVDELLAEGRVCDAEAYMEAERQKLVAAGYYLRRLNQAYFAFHGSYATSPASVDPIGPWMRQLRAQSESLKAFLERASLMSSLDDLLRALDASAP